MQPSPVPCSLEARAQSCADRRFLSASQGKSQGCQSTQTPPALLARRWPLRSPEVWGQEGGGTQPGPELQPPDKTWAGGCSSQDLAWALKTWVLRK